MSLEDQLLLSQHEVLRSDLDLLALVILPKTESQFLNFCVVVPSTIKTKSVWYACRIKVFLLLIWPEGHIDQITT